MQFSGTPTTTYTVDDEGARQIWSNFNFPATVGTRTEIHYVAIQDALHPVSKACVRAPDGNANNQVVTTSSSSSSSVPQWTSLGCYTDSSSSRVLTSAYWSSTSQTVEKCLAWCIAQNPTFVYAGVETNNQ